MDTLTADGWVDCKDWLPDPDVWVWVLENDYIDRHECSIATLLKHEPRYRAVPAKLNYIDVEGYPRWYMIFAIGGTSKPEHTRNVTHWHHMPPLPERPREEWEE